MGISAKRRHDDRPFVVRGGSANASAPAVADVRHAIEKARALDDGDDARSLAAAADAVALSLRVADPALQAAARECLGSCQLHYGNFDEAHASINAAIGIWSFAGDKAGEAGARCAFAELLEKHGQSDRALDESLAALRLAGDSGNLRATTLAHIVVGVIHTSLRQYDDALTVLHKARADAAGAGDPLLGARALNNLGNVHNDRGSSSLRMGAHDAGVADLQQGLALYREAAEQFARLGHVRLEGIAMRNAALGLSVLRRFDEADAILDSQLCASRASQSKASEESALRFKGTAYLEQGRFGEAITTLRAACAIAAQMKYPEREVESHEMLATAYEGAGDYASALRHFRKFHDQQARVVNEVNQRRARAVALQFQAEHAKAEATEAKRRARSLETSNRKLVEETERLSAEALIDPLTGLFNRRHLDIVLREEFSLRSANTACSLALLDIDHFKRVNDGYSHQVGDDVLRQVGAIFHRECRHGEFAVRYGGEEFALVFPGAGLAQARAACDRLRISIERHAWHRLAAGLSVTVSAGVADNAEGHTLDELLAIADRRLYVAKSQGRNRVVASGALL